MSGSGAAYVQRVMSSSFMDFDFSFIRPSKDCICVSCAVAGTYRDRLVREFRSVIPTFTVTLTLHSDAPGSGALIAQLLPLGVIQLVRPRHSKFA